MRYRVLACDYDGTLAHDGVISPPTIAALDRFRRNGRFLLMVTGRELPDLQDVCPVLDKFEWVVAENGALLSCPGDNFSQLLCAPASPQLAQKLVEAGAEPLSVGRAIIATRKPHEVLAIEMIKQLVAANLAARADDDGLVEAVRGDLVRVHAGLERANGLAHGALRAPDDLVGQGFEVTVDSWIRTLDQATLDRFGLFPLEDIYVCAKPRAGTPAAD